MFIADYWVGTWDNTRNTDLETEINNTISTNFINLKSPPHARARAHAHTRLNVKTRPFMATVQ
jgi:hypothetical protein